MRGDDEASLEVEICRTAFDLRKPDAARRTAEALARARRLGDVGQARNLADVLNDYRHRRLDPDDIGATPEGLVNFRHRRQRGDTVEALFRNNSLDYGEQAAALQISSIVECLTAKLWTRACRWEQGRLDSSNSGGGIPERIAQLYRAKYLPWTSWMTDPRSLFSVCSKCDRRYARRISAMVKGLKNRCDCHGESPSIMGKSSFCAPSHSGGPKILTRNCPKSNACCLLNRNENVS